MYCEHNYIYNNTKPCDKLETRSIVLGRYAKPDTPLTIRYLCDKHTEVYANQGWYVLTDREIMLRCAPEIAGISRNSRENGQ